MKSLMMLAASIPMMIAPSFAGAQTSAPATANPPPITMGPWAGGNRGDSKSQCNPGEFVVGIEVEAPGAKRCVACVSRLRVICQRYGI